MSLKNRHTTIGLIIISILIIIDSFVVIRFFTDDKLKEVTFSQASLNDYENIISDKVAKQSDPEVMIFEDNKDDEKITNETIIDKTSISSKEAIQTKNSDTINLSTNDNKNIPNTKKEKEIINTTKNVEDSDIPMQVDETFENKLRQNDVPMRVSETKTTSSRSSSSRTEVKTEETSAKPKTEPHIEEEPKEVAKPEPKQLSATTSNSANSNSIGKIEIPKTGVNLPILQKVSVAGMEVATCFLYTTGSINEYGTTIIVGHNYCNGKLFSNNKQLQIGDKIYITANGVRKEYTIYDKFITTDDDISYLERNTSNEAQIALSTCTDNEEKRLVILAK